MKNLTEDHLDRLLAPRAIDPHWVAMILQPHMPEYSLLELEVMAAERAAEKATNASIRGHAEHDKIGV